MTKEGNNSSNNNNYDKKYTFNVEESEIQTIQQTQPNEILLSEMTIQKLSSKPAMIEKAEEPIIDEGLTISPKKPEIFEPFQKFTGSMNEDSVKMIEEIKQMFTNFKPNINIKSEDIERSKQIEELTEKLEYFEKEKNYLQKNFSVKEAYYEEQIKSLETQISNTKSVDINLLSKQNKELELKIAHLNKIISNMNTKQLEEKQKFNNKVTEVLSLKEKLLNEMESLEKMRKEIKIPVIDEVDKVMSPKYQLIVKQNNKEKSNLRPKYQLIVKQNESKTTEAKQQVEQVKVESKEAEKNLITEVEPKVEPMRVEQVKYEPVKVEPKKVEPKKVESSTELFNLSLEEDGVFPVDEQTIV